jgi:uncharacterized protein YqgV (UPF0045/DUF77 family)
MAFQPNEFSNEPLNTDAPTPKAPTPSSSLSDMPTPPKCTADFCLIPLGTPTASVSKEVAEVQRLLKKSGLNYSMHSAGTTVGMYPASVNPRSVVLANDQVEGSWDDCMRVIGQCHAMLHSNGVVRIQSDIRVGTRTDKYQTFAMKVQAVEDLLAKDTSRSQEETSRAQQDLFARQYAFLSSRGDE